MNGRMTGIIISNDNQENTVLRAVSVAEIKCLLEILSNGEPICYTGIRGTTISKMQSEQLNIPQGIFVDRVEQGSPAMNAGIQSGDILYKVGARGFLPWMSTAGSYRIRSRENGWRSPCIEKVPRRSM